MKGGAMHRLLDDQRRYQDADEMLEVIEEMRSLLRYYLAGVAEREEGLTAQQCRILHILKRAGGRWVTPGVILVALHGDFDQAGENSVRVQIHKIRRLRPDLGANIETRHVFGYRWIGLR